MKAQLQAAIANTTQATGGTAPPTPPVTPAPVATLAQRIAAATTLPALLAMEAEARVSPEQGVWLVYLDAVSTLHASVVAAQVQTAATKAAADAAAAQAAVDALLQSSILQIIGKVAPMIAAAPALLAQVQPALDAYRASRNANQTLASIINQMASTPLPTPASHTPTVVVDPDGFNW